MGAKISKSAGDKIGLMNLRGESERLMASSYLLDASPKWSVRDTLVTAGKTGSIRGGGSREGLGESMTIGSGEGLDEGCAAGVDARRRKGDREPDKGA